MHLNAFSHRVSRCSVDWKYRVELATTITTTCFSFYPGTPVLSCCTCSASLHLFYTCKPIYIYPIIPVWFLAPKSSHATKQNQLKSNTKIHQNKSARARAHAHKHTLPLTNKQWNKVIIVSNTHNLSWKTDRYTDEETVEKNIGNIKWDREEGRKSLREVDNCDEGKKEDIKVKYSSLSGIEI